MSRKPQAFVLGPSENQAAQHPATPDPQSHGKSKPKPHAQKARSVPHINFEPEHIDQDLAVVPATHAKSGTRGFRWGALLLSTLAALAALWAGMATTQLIESSSARSPALGWMVTGIAGLAATAALAIIIREVWGLIRLDRIEALQETVSRAINLDEAEAARNAIAGLRDLYRGRPDVAWSLKAFASHGNDIMDPKDRIKLAERLIMEPLDGRAHAVIAKRARRVTLLTTVTPAAALDILFVAAQNFAMLRELASLYGGRPSTLATLKLGRMVVTHLAVTGGLALSDSLIQHVVGRGLLGRLSARFGEGAVNGILTGRIGLAAMDVCRPIPSPTPARRSLGKVLRQVISFSEEDTRHGPGQPQS